MPNYCSNRILISGKDLLEFKKTLESKDDKLLFSFSQTIPRPKDEEENWYIWNINNWGTKWDISENVYINDNTFSIQCDTAWSPPIEWAKNCLKKYDLNIEIGYCEMGCQFYGYWNNKDGENTMEFEDGDLEYDEDEFILGGNLKKHVEKYEIGLGG